MKIASAHCCMMEPSVSEKSLHLRTKLFLTTPVFLVEGIKIFRPILQIYNKIFVAFLREQRNAILVIVK